MIKISLLLVLFINTLLIAQSYSGGSGTSGDPYQIANKTDLKYLSEHSGEWGKYFIQTANINFSTSDFQSGGDFHNSGNGFIPIGNSSTKFTGSYDGDGHKITGLFISRSSTDYIGLFGSASNAVMKNIGLISVDINGGNAVAGLAGDAQYCGVSNSYSTGSVSGSNYVGGLVGGIVGTIVANSYSTVLVSGSSYVGGLAGFNLNGTVSKSYSTGSVSGSSYVGGLAGYISGSGSISNSFWDTETSGQSSSASGSGKTTAQMKTESTFTDAGWDFTNTWSISSGTNDGYPYLQNVTPMPVELSEFSVKVNGDKVGLNWETATEVNNYGFEIERRIPDQARNDNINWAKIGFVAGAGNSNSPKNYSFTDQPTGGTSFSYRLKQIDNDGKFKYYDAITVTLDKKLQAELIGNYPNPFNPSTKIKFYLPETENVRIKIYDMLGREVNTLINKQTNAGYHNVYWNGRDNYGKSVASGVYIYRLKAGAFIQTKKMVVLK